MSDPRGTIVSLQICPGHREPMQMRQSLRAIANLGLEGDWHAHPSGSRQVLLIDEETLKALDLKPGMVKENVTTRGMDMKSLARGARLRIGGALFEIMKPCTPCARMDEIRAGLRQALEGQRGMLARVVESGMLRVGDAIEVVNK